MSGKLIAIIVAIALHLGLVFYLYTRQGNLLYYPQNTRVSASLTDYSLPRGDVTLRGWAIHTDADDALLYFGGNGERIEDMREDLARWAPDRAIYLVAYRGYGASDGEPRQDALFADAVALYDEVARRHRHVAAIGRSLGSGVATYLASVRPVERLVLVTPYDSIARVARAHYPFAAEWLVRDKYESWRYAPAVHCPVVVIEAEQDEVIPQANTQSLIRAFSPAPQVVRLYNAGHNTVQDSGVYGETLSRFLH